MLEQKGKGDWVKIADASSVLKNYLYTMMIRYVQDVM
jgi:hypothetical protein